MAHPIENILKTTMEELRQMVDVNTIVGDPVMMGNDTVIVPVSKVCLGFLSGGGEYETKCKRRDEREQSEEKQFPFAGTSVAGMNLTPLAFLTISGGDVRMLPVNYSCTVDRIIEMVPSCIKEIEKIAKDVCSRKQPDENETVNQNEPPQGFEE
ncbi:GerW family sporulation protein [Eubacteriales bacterium OttesenSCG-928-K08]|nr:GerW family sporulation protein [Eubacteriales bacterium OttesenSCG-928-K08]